MNPGKLVFSRKTAQITKPNVVDVLDVKRVVDFSE